MGGYSGGLRGLPDYGKPVSAVRLSDSLQRFNTVTWSEWLLSLKDYKLARQYYIEINMPPTEQPENTFSYIWIPLEKI